MSYMSMQCPSCSKGTIHYTLEGLLHGSSFRCDTCDVTVSLGAESSNTENEAFKKLNELKKDNS